MRKPNLGRADRVLRLLATLGLSTCAALAPLSLELRLAAFAAPAVYLLLSALAGRCVGYTLLGKTSCAGEFPR